MRDTRSEITSKKRKPTPFNSGQPKYYLLLMKKGINRLMSNCVYTAFSDHLAELGIETNALDWITYRAIKLMSQGSLWQPTYGGIVPYLAHIVAKHHRLCVNIQHRLWDKKCYMDDANAVQRRIIQASDFGEFVDKLTLNPSVRLWNGMHHALYIDWYCNSYFTYPHSDMMAIKFKPYRTYQQILQEDK